MPHCGRQGPQLHNSAALSGPPSQWPELSRSEFWRMVRWFNADARERGRAVDGRDQLALEHATRAVLEAWGMATAARSGRQDASSGIG